MMMRNLRANQSGVALVMAMMIVALVAVIAVEISWRFELNISRSGNRWQGMQAKAYLEGAEHLAMRILVEDTLDKETSGSDHLGQPWAQDSEPFPTDHGWVSGKIEDAHGRLNINTLIPAGGECPDGSERPCKNESPCDDYSVHQRLFIRLLQTINLAETPAVAEEAAGEVEQEPERGFTEDEIPVFVELAEAEAITEAVIDWLDADSEIRTRTNGGAESDYYEALVPPMSIANGPMVSISELQIIKGMRPEIYAKLVDYIVALPEEVKKINIATAPVNVLQTLTPSEPKINCSLEPMPVEDAQEIADTLLQNEYQDWETFVNAIGDFPGIWQSSSDDAAGLAPDEEAMIIGQSTYFLFFSETMVGDDHIRRGSSLIKRDTDESSNESGTVIDVVRRTDANF